MSNNTKKEVKANNRKRFKEIVDILKKYEIYHGITPHQLVDMLTDLGPTFVKFGQILSMRSDILPQEYCDELGNLRADVNPLSFEVVKEVIEEECMDSLENIFTSFDEKPLGSASMGQVHLAKISDQQVVVKVQRPGIYETMSTDITLIKKAITLLEKTNILTGPLDIKALMDEMWRITKEELDFTIEAEHFQTFYKLNENIAYATCPKVYSEYCTTKMEVMEYVAGVSINSANELIADGYNLEEIGEKLCYNYAKQILDDGFFHADPHSGNIKIVDGKIVWLDLGMVGQFNDHDKHMLIEAVKAIGDNNASRLVDVVFMIVPSTDGCDRRKLVNDIDILLNKYVSTNMADVDIVALNENFTQVIRSHNLEIPSKFTMLGRGLVTISGVLLTLSKNLSFLDVMQKYLAESFMENFDLQTSIKHTVKTGAYSLKKALEIPSQISDALGSLSKGRTTVNMELSMTDKMKKDISDMINKVIMSIVTAALLVASSLICTTNMSARLWGIPALGLLGYIIALVLGVKLVFSMRKSKNK